MYKNRTFQGPRRPKITCIVKGAGRWKWEIFGFIILIIVLAIIAYFIYKYYKKKKHEKQEKELSQKNSNSGKDIKMTHYITNSHDNFYSSSSIN